MRVAFATDTLPSEGLGGGIGTYTVLIARELARRGADVHVFRWGAPRAYQRYEQQGVTYHVCPAWISLRRETPAAALAWRAAHTLCDELGMLFALRYYLKRAARSHPFDVMEFPDFGAPAAAAIRLRGVGRLHVRLHSCSMLCRQFRSPAGAGRRRLIDRLEAWTASQAVQVTCPSAAALEATERCWDRKLPGVRVIPNPIDAPPAAGARSSPVERTILFPGRMEQLKGLDVLAGAIPDILKVYPDAVFRLFGQNMKWPDGRHGSQVVKDVLKGTGIAEDRIQIVGPVARDRLLEEMKRAAAVVVPSRFETFGLTVTEAMACGSPVVASDIPAFREIIRSEEEGLLFPTGDARGLARQVLSLLQSPERWERMSRGAYARSLDFGVPRILDQLLETWTARRFGSGGRLAVRYS